MIGLGKRILIPPFHAPMDLGLFEGWVIRDPEGKRVTPVFDYSGDEKSFLAQEKGVEWWQLERAGFRSDHWYENSK